MLPVSLVPRVLWFLGSRRRVMIVLVIVMMEKVVVIAFVLGAALIWRRRSGRSLLLALGQVAHGLRLMACQPTGHFLRHHGLVLQSGSSANTLEVL